MSISPKALCIFINYTDKESEVRSFEKVSAPDVNKFPCIIMKRKQLRSYFNRYKYPKSTCQLLVVKRITQIYSQKIPQTLRIQ